MKQKYNGTRLIKDNKKFYIGVSDREYFDYDIAIPKDKDGNQVIYATGRYETMEMVTRGAIDFASLLEASGVLEQGRQEKKNKTWQENINTLGVDGDKSVDVSEKADSISEVSGV